MQAANLFQLLGSTQILTPLSQLHIEYSHYNCLYCLIILIFCFREEVGLHFPQVASIIIVEFDRFYARPIEIPLP